MKWAVEEARAMITTAAPVLDLQKALRDPAVAEAAQIRPEMLIPVEQAVAPLVAVAEVPLQIVSVILGQAELVETAW
jgi:hypothetical protein